MKRAPSSSIAIVGLGPKGLYCLERLLAELASNPLPSPVTIHVINHSVDFGVSPIYAHDLSDYILLNNSVGDIDMWSDQQPPTAGGRGPAFVKWYNEKFTPDTPITGADYLPRRTVGRYLSEGFEQLRNNIPDNVELICHVGEVLDLWPEDDRYSLAIESDAGTQNIAVDKILLATGHSQVKPGAEAIRHTAFAETCPAATFIPFVYPLSERLSQIKAGSNVAMKGIGLSFIDAVIELSEGRGGQFTRISDGTLQYMPSGHEPRKIFGYCRTGLPMSPKSADLPIELRPLVFVTPDAFRALKQNTPGGKLDFDSQLWPLFELEMEHVYYQVAMGPGAWFDRLVGCGNNANTMRRIIAEYLIAHPQQPPLNIGAILDPLADHHFDSAHDYNLFITTHMQDEINRACAGQMNCPRKAAIEVWFEVRYALGQVLQFGGLTPESHKSLKNHYFPLLKRLVFGPPIVNAEKLLALVKAGIVDLSFARNPRVTVDAATSSFKLQCEQIPNAVAYAQVMIDARYPRVDIAQDTSSLYQNLIRRGLIRPFDNAGYKPGAIDITPGSQFVIGRNGVADENIVVTGIPTEGNLVGNKTITRGAHHGRWAQQTVRQLREAYNS